MADKTKHWCVLIPCSSTETWAVPQNCLAEIVTLPADSPLPPRQLQWRERTVPVLDLGNGDGSVWQQSRRETGLVAIFLGLKGEGCEYWGVAVRGEGLVAAGLSPEAVEDLPGRALEHTTAAFMFNGVLCQVPDLDSLQKRMSVGQRAA